MSRLRRYEVALEAEEEIYWGCFYFFLGCECGAGSGARRTPGSRSWSLCGA